MVKMTVRVDVATVWTDPAAPREVDGAAVADVPRIAQWLALLDTHPLDDRAGDGRLGLHGRVDTQAVSGEPVIVRSDPDAEWVHVRLPWQPSRQDPGGYPGWVRRAHLAEGSAADASGDGTPAATSRAGVLELAHTRLGVAYLWGGCSELGLDCSGLVHSVWRALGVVVPRDADDQQEVAEPVPLGSERPGDLYFFADPGGAVDHVGIVVRPGWMIDAAEGRGAIAEGPLAPARQATLYAAGRLPLR